MPEEDEMESSDSDFSDAWEDDMDAKAVDGLTFVNDSFSDHHETSFWRNIVNNILQYSSSLLLSNAKNSGCLIWNLLWKSCPLLVPVD